MSFATTDANGTTKLNSVVNQQGTWLLGGESNSKSVSYNSTYVQSGSINCYWTTLSTTRRIVTVQFDVVLKGTFSSENICRICNSGSLPVSIAGGAIYVCYGTNTYAPAKVNIENGMIAPWYCGTVSGQWYGAITYLAS